MECLYPSKPEGFFFLHWSVNDLDRRMSKHFDGFSKYTSSKRPWRLGYFETFASRTEAIRREKQLKSMKSRAFIEKSLIENWLQSG